MRQAILSSQLGSFTSTERGACDGMLRVAPIGLAFAYDPGRAFLIGAEASALVDGEFNSYLCAGVVSLMVALTASGALMSEAINETVDFIRPLDWSGEVFEALRRSLEPEGGPRFSRALASEALSIVIPAVQNASSMGEAASNVLVAGAEPISASLVGQLAVLAYAPNSTKQIARPIQVGGSILIARSL